MRLQLRELNIPLQFERVSQSYVQESISILRLLGSPTLIPDASTFIQVSLFGIAINEWVRANTDKIVRIDRVCANPMKLGETFQKDCGWIAEWSKGVYVASAGINTHTRDYFLIVPKTKVGELKTVYEELDKTFLGFIEGIIEHWPVWDRKPVDEHALDNVFLPDNLKDDIIADFESFLGSKAEYGKLGLPWRRGYMFIGPPGNGKTKTIRSLCNYWGLEADDMATKIDQSGNLRLDTPSDTLIRAARRRSIAFDIEDLESEGNDIKKAAGLVKLPEKLVRRMLEVIEQGARPNVYFLEDIDKFVAFQTGSDANHQDVGEMSLHSLLKGLDGVEQKGDSIIIATTNFADQLAEALINRPGRFDRVWDFPKPGADRIAQLFKSFELRVIENGRNQPKHLENICHILAEAGANMAFAEELVKSALSIHKRKDISIKEINELTERIKSHLEFCANRFGENHRMGFGAAIGK